MAKAGKESTAEALLAKYGKTRNRGPKCGMATYPRTSLVVELVAGGMSAARVAEVVATEYGDILKGQSIARHVRGECMCPR